MTSLKSLIKKYHKAKSRVKIFIDGTYRDGDGFFVTGCIVGYDEDTLILRKNSEYQFDGYVYIPIHRVGNIYHYKDMVLCEYIMCQEGIMDKLYEGYDDLPQILGIDDSKSAFDIVCTSKQILSIDCDTSCKIGRHEGAWHIGYVESTSKRGIYFRYVNSIGKWNKKPYYISYKSIMTITIGDYYAKTFVKYCDPKPK